MKKYRFQIQKAINVIVEAENEIDARLYIIDNIDRYADEMVQDPYVSEGVEI